ncbi:MAG: hypothetical protein GXO25_08240 [Euryarchaeota archaeon]|nr:hypothetical protein [Euryarchaeota archaeon]
MNTHYALSSMVMVLFAVFSVIVIFTVGGVPSLEHDNAEVVVDSDLQILDVAGIYGGHITWTINGELAHELRMLIGSKFGVNYIDLSVASHYFKGDLERVVEDNRFDCGYLGFVRIEHADPLHGDTDGILNDKNDIAGLIGPVNSTEPITLRMLIRGEPVSGTWDMVSKNLTLAPFYALASTSADIKKMNLTAVSVAVHHREILAGLGNFNIPDGTFRTRLVLGEFFMASRGQVSYSSFSFIDSPLILFLLYIGVAYGIGRINYSLVDDKTGTLMEKRARTYVAGIRVLLLFMYLLLPLSGIWLIALYAVVVFISYVVIGRFYRRYGS